MTEKPSMHNKKLTNAARGQGPVCLKCWKEYRALETQWEKVPDCDCREPDKLASLRLSPGLFDWIFGRPSAKG